jgi:hypothetical protein
MMEGTHKPKSVGNTLLIIISIARDVKAPGGRTTSTFRYFNQVVSRFASLLVYAFGTAIFSSAALLAIPVAEMILVLVLGAGVLSRVIAKNMVRAIDQRNSMVHIVSKNEHDAEEVVRSVFMHQMDEDSTKFQIEVDGHFFLDQRKVGRRSIWHRRILGLLAMPYNITRHVVLKD